VRRVDPVPAPQDRDSLVSDSKHEPASLRWRKSKPLWISLDQEDGEAAVLAKTTELQPETSTEERLMQVVHRLSFDQRSVAHAVVADVHVAPFDVNPEPFDEVGNPARAFVHISDDRNRRQ
jgi:hypothetical protein